MPRPALPIARCRAILLALLALGCGSVAVDTGKLVDGGGRADGPAGDRGPGGGSNLGNEPQPLGGACEVGANCESGYCSDGVCCDVACTGACVACDLAGLRGRCTPQAAGAEDRHGICRAEPRESCGMSGFCNGQGGCARYTAGTVCREPSCSDAQHFVPASLCDGDGLCRHGTALACNPSTCQGGACLNACTSDATCVPPETCVNGSCGPKGLGQDCLSNEQCASRFCVDGVCCDNACAGRCVFCANPEARGKCTPGKVGALDQRAARGERDPNKICVDQGAGSCGQNGRCDGASGCQRYADGTICREPRCDSAGNSDVGPGMCGAGSCRVPGAQTCAPFLGCNGNRCREGCEDDDQCAGDFVCLDSGLCGKRSNGQACARGSECLTGNCAQGRCCATACAASCKSCALAGQEGTCANVGVGGADPAGGCRDDACSNGCDGAGGCRREVSGTSCGQPGCGPGNSILTRTCNGNGTCESRSMAGPPCGRCGGTTLCDGSCSRPTPPNLDNPCGKCGGRVRCDGSCSVTDPPNVGGACGSAGSVDCTGGCRGPLFRLYHDGVGDHFYTMSAEERDGAVNTFGYRLEGVTCNLYEREVSGTVPLFRLYHGPTGDHFYTVSADERDGAVNTFGYVFEGITGFVYRTQVPGTIPLFRLYNGGVGDHFYTTSSQERDGAINTFGYVDEGVAAFVLP
jgi:hypothetical protein